MAARKKNIKTHPDPDAGGYVDPSRTDLVGTSTEEPVVIDLKANTEDLVDLTARGNDGGAGDGGVRQDDEPARPQRRERQPARATEEDGESYGKKVRARLKRERNLLNRERELREQTNQQLTEERTARQALESRVGQMERKQLDITTNGGVKELEAKIAGLKTSLGAAIEAGETAKQLDLTIQLGDLQSDLKLLKFKLEQAQADASRRQEEERRANPTGGQGADEGRAASPFTPEELESIGDWQKANRHWMKRSKFKDAQEAAVEIDRDIIQDVRAGNEDFDLYSEEHLEELSRRLREEFPDLPVVDAAGDDYGFEEDDVDRDDGRGDRRNGGRQMNGRGERIGDRERGGSRNPAGGRPAQGGIGQGGRRQPSAADLARQGKVQLNQEDFNQMRTFGMDPNNPEHKKAFAKERMRTVLTEERNGGGAR